MNAKVVKSLRFYSDQKFDILLHILIQQMSCNCFRKLYTNVASKNFEYKYAPIAWPSNGTSYGQRTVHGQLQYMYVVQRIASITPRVDYNRNSINLPIPQLQFIIGTDTKNRKNGEKGPKSNCNFRQINYSEPKIRRKIPDTCICSSPLKCVRFLSPPFPPSPALHMLAYVLYQKKIGQSATGNKKQKFRLWTFERFFKNCRKNDCGRVYIWLKRRIIR